MKQTAVEWLEKEIFRNYKFLLQKVDCSRLQESIEKAKEMEKEQIIDAFNKGDVSIYGVEINGQQYYNETFNK
jgi:hypothetical protein